MISQVGIKVGEERDFKWMMVPIYRRPCPKWVVDFSYGIPYCTVWSISYQVIYQLKFWNRIKPKNHKSHPNYLNIKKIENPNESTSILKIYKT